MKAIVLSEIKELIHLKLEKAMKKQKKEFKSAVDKLQKRVSKLEHAHGDLEQYGCRLCVPVKDIPVATNKTVGKVIEKVENILKEVRPNVIVFSPVLNT